MTKHNPSNERIKRQYFAYQKEARRLSEATLDATAKALNRFEEYTRYRDFKAFHIEQAMAFKNHLAVQDGLRSGTQLSKATILSTLTHLKRFFQWLAGQPGYKSRLQYADAEYFNLSEKDTRVATAKRAVKYPTVDQVKHVIASMPADTEIAMRDRALVAFTLLTAARDSAIASAKLKHIDLTAGCFYQDAREVNTKFSKTFTTYFFPVGEEVRQVVVNWMKYLREDKLWADDDPLFPATRVEVGAARQFEAVGIDRKHWSTANPIREIFKVAFKAAGLPYYNPHSFRNTLVRMGETLCKTPEHFKAWSQNLGHENVLTTFLSYGEVPAYRQDEIMRGLGQPQVVATHGAEEIATAVYEKLRKELLASRT